MEVFEHLTCVNFRQIELTLQLQEVCRAKAFSSTVKFLLVLLEVFPQSVLADYCSF